MNGMADGFPAAAQIISKEWQATKVVSYVSRGCNKALSPSILFPVKSYCVVIFCRPDNADKDSAREIHRPIQNYSCCTKIPLRQLTVSLPHVPTPSPLDFKSC